jgi:membrane-associated phospholipid phosphatase
LQAARSKKPFGWIFAASLFTVWLIYLVQTGLACGAEITDDQSSDTTLSKSRSLTDTLIADARSFGEISVRMCLAPFHANGKELLEVAGLVSVVALSSTLDRRIREHMTKLDHPWADAVSDVGRLYQNTYVTFGAAGAFYTYGWWRNNPALRRIGIEILEAFEISGAGTSLLKHLVGRDRPFVERGPHHFVGPNWDSDDHLSFVSGDATKAFALTSVLSAEAKSAPVTILLYSLATTTAFQRLHADRHWFSDIIGAAIWGSAVGYGVVHLNHRHTGTPLKLSLHPSGNLALIFNL